MMVDELLIERLRDLLADGILTPDERDTVKDAINALRSRAEIERLTQGDVR